MEKMAKLINSKKKKNIKHDVVTKVLKIEKQTKPLVCASG